jgi:hypothetical protein
MKAKICIAENGLEYIGNAEDNTCIGSIAELKKCENVLVEKSKHGYNIMIDDRLFTNVERPAKHSGIYGSTYVIWL